MKFKLIKIEPQEGETKAETISRVIKDILDQVKNQGEKPAENPVDLAPEEDNCQCNVCQLRRTLQAAMKKNDEQDTMFPNVVEAAKNEMEEELDRVSPFLSEAGLTFSQALESMKNNYRVVRADAWPAVMSIGVQNEGRDGLVPEHVCQYYNHEDTPMEFFYIAPYTLTSEDILATDWRVLKQS